MNGVPRLVFAGVNLAALANVVTKLSPEALVILCDKTNRLNSDCPWSRGAAVTEEAETAAEYVNSQTGAAS